VSNTAVFPLAEENKHVKELVRLLAKHKRGKDAQGTAAVFNYICGMESDLKKAMGEIATLRNDLSVMHEEQKHPIKTMLHKAADSLMSKLKSVYRQILSLKDKFIGGCKQAAEAIKDKGIVAANSVVGVLNIKGDLESSREHIKEVIAYNEKKIAGIEAAAAEYHTAGRAVKNIGLALMGRETVPDIKPNGKLAKLLQAPFRSEIRSLNRSLARTDKALVRIDKLEKAAELRSEREKPSVLDEMTRHKTTAREQPELSVPKKFRVANQEI
jgi:hypothetical protein